MQFYIPDIQYLIEKMNLSTMVGLVGFKEKLTKNEIWSEDNHQTERPKCQAIVS